METNGETAAAHAGKNKDHVEVSNGGTIRRRSVLMSLCDLVLRLLALALTLTATVLVGVDKQTKIVSITVVSTLPPVNIPVVAKWQYMPAFVYFLVSNAIASCYAAISLLLKLANKGGNRSLTLLMIIIMDLVMVSLLFSGNGAALAIGLLGYQGNSHVQWKKVCNVFDKFCSQVAAAAVISMLASITYLLLVIFAAFKLHKKV